jgi:hypothetical protein
MRFIPLAIVAGAAFATSVRADLTSLAPISPISIRVEQVSDDKRTRFEDSQKKTLQIHLTNDSPKDQAVKVKFYYFAKDQKDNAVTVFKEGKKSATVKAHAEAVVQADAAVAKAVEKHQEGTAYRGRTAKEVAASGEHLVGYGVQVFQNSKLAAEYFSEPSLKSNVGGGD